jgi:3-methyl-2-oxobutanoate hydroxymethyltransferase
MYTQLEQRGMVEPPVNVATLQKMKADGEAIACLTAYDASFSVLVDAAGVDLILVGDSLGMVVQGHDTTVPVTVADIIYHTKNVSVLLMQEGGAMMIKLEGGDGQLDR